MRAALKFIPIVLIILSALTGLGHNKEKHIKSHNDYVKMKKITLLLIVFVITTALLLTGCSGNTNEKQQNKAAMESHTGDKIMHNMHSMEDHRVSLHLSPEKAKHQLMNMRNHLQAVQQIINYLSKDDFDSASFIASSRLGLTNEMKKMCSSFGNEKFENLGLEFHKSADKMSEVMKTKNKNKALEALTLTLNYCVTCHSVFRQ